MQWHECFRVNVLEFVRLEVEHFESVQAGERGGVLNLAQLVVTEHEIDELVEARELKWRQSMQFVVAEVSVCREEGNANSELINCNQLG